MLLKRIFETIELKMECFFRERVDQLVRALAASQARTASLHLEDDPSEKR